MAQPWTRATDEFVRQVHREAEETPMEEERVSADGEQVD